MNHLYADVEQGTVAESGLDATVQVPTEFAIRLRNRFALRMRQRPAMESGRSQCGLTFQLAITFPRSDRVDCSIEDV